MGLLRRVRVSGERSLDGAPAKSRNGVVGSTYPRRCIRNAEFAAIAIEKLSGARRESSLPGHRKDLDNHTR